MSLVTKNPTANESPDTGQGGSAVTGASNTGHAATSADASGVGSAETKTCRWFSFTNVGGQRKSVTLKLDHESTGLLSGGTAGNQFFVEYSVNGGSSWTGAVARSNFNTSQGPTTFSVALNVTQDISQVQVRDNIFAQSNDVGDSANASVVISNIKIEVETIDANVIVMM